MGSKGGGTCYTRRGLIKPSLRFLFFLDFYFTVVIMSPIDRGEDILFLLSVRLSVRPPRNRARSIT